MTQLTYTFIHLKIGAEKYWEEVEGRVRVACDLQDIEVFATTSYTASTTISYSLSANQRTLSAQESKSFSNGKGVENTTYIPIQSLETLQRNDNLPLSELANRLGATIYGGFEDEKDFYLVLPTVEGLKVGDIFNFVREETEIESFLVEFGKYQYSDCCGLMYNYDSILYGFYYTMHCIYGNGEKVSSEYPIDFIKQYKITNNIFQEYARTGIIENDLYKQFFK